LINFSFGADTRSDIVLDAVRFAADNGVLCVCAAGNSGGHVMWPARSSEVVAVGALGQVGSYPIDSLAASQINATGRAPGDLVVANFSCYGAGLNCCAPGVGIISTVPDGDFWLPWDGTSMASPAVCGLLATILSGDAKYQNMPRNRARRDAARDILQRKCHLTGLPVDKAGWGMPVL